MVQGHDDKLNYKEFFFAYLRIIHSVFLAWIIISNTNYISDCNEWRDVVDKINIELPQKTLKMKVIKPSQDIKIESVLHFCSIFLK